MDSTKSLLFVPSSIICDTLTVAQESIQGRLTSEDRHSLESQVDARTLITLGWSNVRGVICIV